MYLSPKVITINRPRRIKWSGLGRAELGGTGHVAGVEKRKIHKVFLVGTPEGKSLLARPRYRWEDQNAWTA
jgi:hypothetical protein